MSETRFTPGPWRVYWMRPITQMEPYQVSGADGERVTRWGAFIKPSQARAKANAHLIAAAPDMFAALEGVEEFLGETGFIGSTLDEVRAALRKASGETA